MLSDVGAKSRLSGNVDGGIVAIEERSRGDDADLVLGDVGRDNGMGHGAKLSPLGRSTFTHSGLSLGPGVSSRPGRQ